MNDCTSWLPEKKFKVCELVGRTSGELPTEKGGKFPGWVLPSVPRSGAHQLRSKHAGCLGHLEAAFHVPRPCCSVGLGPGAFRNVSSFPTSGSCIQSAASANGSHAAQSHFTVLCMQLRGLLHWGRGKRSCGGRGLFKFYTEGLTHKAQDLLCRAFREALHNSRGAFWLLCTF